MALETLRQKLSSLPGSSESAAKPSVSPLPRLSLPSFNSSFNTANSTPAVMPAGSRGTVDLLKSGLKLLNPLQKMQARPLFARADQTEEIYGGGLIVGAHALAARTIEAIPAIALTTLANFKLAGSTRKGDTSVKGGQIPIPFDASRLGITDQVGQKFVQDSGNKMIQRFEEYEEAHPGRPANIALASLSPIIDALDAFATGDILQSVARVGLKATNYSPELEKALQQYGLKGFKGDDLAHEFGRRFEQKANKLILEKDIVGLNELGQATNVIATHMTGKGIPQLNRLGQLVQDLSRLGLQDARYGFRLQNPLFAEIAPDVARTGLPGYVWDEARPVPMGLSTRRVRRVGGAEDQPAGGPYFRSAEGGKRFDPVDEKNVMEAPIRQDLDTFVTKTDDGYAVIEGKTGQQLGETEKTMAAAISSAKKAIDDMPEGQLDKLIDESPLSPRYTQVEDEAVKPLNLDIPKPAKKPNMTPDTPENAAKEYFDQVIRRDVSEGKAFTIGADDMKDFFGKDYNDKNHPIYSRGAFLLYEKALAEHGGDTVILTGGGPGAGKTEILVDNIKKGGFDGIIYDSNMSNFDGVKKQIQMAKNYGKDVMVYGVLPDLGSTRVHTILRENATGRGISDKTFARGHAGFPKVLKQLMDEGILKPDEVRLFDTRQVFSKERARDMVLNGDFEKNPLALLRKVQYNEEDVAKRFSKENFDSKTGRPIQDARIRGGDDRSPRPDRADRGQGVATVDAKAEARLDKAVERRAAGDRVTNPAEAAAPKDPRPHLSTSEIDSYDALAEQHRGGDYYLNTSAREEERITSNLEQIFADLKGVEVSDLRTKFTPEDLEQVQLDYQFANDMLVDHPGRALTKFISKKEGQFLDPKDPKFAKTPKEAERIRERNAKLMKAAETATEGTKWSETFDDPDTIRDLIEDYLSIKSRVGEVQENMRRIARDIRLAKQARKFVESKKGALARETAKNMDALSSIVAAAERSGFQRGIKEGSKKLAAMVKRLKNRRSQIKALQKVYDLTDGQMKAIRGTKDPRFMDRDEFDAYLKNLESKAAVEKEKSIERMIIEGMVQEKDLKNIDNLRTALEMPPISKMSLEQLQEFDNILSRYQQFDSFLGPRMIQTVQNTDLGAVKTVREIRAALAKDTGADLSELSDVRGNWTDKFAYDAELAEKNPLYKYMVTEFTAKLTESDQVIHALETKLNQLARAARKSRKRTVADKLVPQDKVVFDYLETPAQEKDIFKRDMRMTPAEVEYAEFVESLYRKWRDVLIDKGTLKKWRSNYITHTTRSFFETWKDDGFIKSLGNWWKQFGEQRIDFEAIGDTGEVLGLEKFFKYSLPREGGLVPSKNVAKVVMQYANSFYKKQALDSIIPKVEAYTFSLQRPQIPGTPKDPTMVGIDGKLRRFVRQWLNNKKGRRIEYILSQGGQLDASLRALKLFVSMRDLGINLISNTANLTGATMANFFGLSTKNFATGLTRSTTKQGRQLLRKYPGVVGHPPYRQIVSAANDVGDTFTAGMFYIMQEFAYRAKGQFFLGSLTKEELKSGVISAARQAEIKLEMARFHPMDDMASLVGNTSEGKLFMMYKSWAVPLLYTARRNTSRVVRMLKQAEGLSGKAKVAKTREAKELFKLTLGAMGAYTFWQQVFGDDDETDQSGLARFKRRVAQELASSLSALDPNTWHKVRMWDFVGEISEITKQLITLEQYEKSGRTYDSGDLKGIEGLQQLLTPAAVRQFMPAEGGSGGKPIAVPKGSNVPAASALNRLNRLKPRGGNVAPGLNQLNRLKRQLGN